MACRLGTSFRTRPADETLALAKGLMPVLGVSRVTNITRLDRLGIPVFASVRPRGMVLRVHAGKGLRPAEAQVGALMEAVEYAAAEPQNSRWTIEEIRLADIPRQLGDALRLADLIPLLGVELKPSRSVHGVACEDLSTGRKVVLPAELIFEPYEAESNPALFGWTSNGLASGNSLEEATLHALFEVLERDAISMNSARDVSQWVEPATLPGPLAEAAARWSVLGVEIGVRHVPNPFELPCFEVTLHDTNSEDVNLATGMGLHVDRDIALARAFCEAAQSRLTCIHGGREDLTDFYVKYDRRNTALRQEAEFGLSKRTFDKASHIDFDAVPGAHNDDARSLESVLDHVLATMARAGFTTVCRHRFALDLNGLHVVKVVVPKCEDLVLSEGQRIGPRLLARIVGDG